MADLIITESGAVHRPRNVDWKRAAALLYGDWGTSKAYVIGLAFAVAGYSSFWLIASMCLNSSESAPPVMTAGSCNRS